MVVSRIDILIENHGALFLLWAETPAAASWLHEHTPEDAASWGPAHLPPGSEEFVRDVKNQRGESA